MSGTPWLVVGLGNPGPGYAGNRHNAGRMVVAELADRASARLKRHKANASVAEGWLVPGGPKFVFAQPNSFMNLSGGPVSQLMRFYSLEADHLIVVHDELDIPFDTIKLKNGGGHGGHNGIRDIVSALGTADFARVRVGIGRPPGRQNVIDYVLHDFNSTERAALPSLISEAADAVEAIATDGLIAAQRRFHAPRP